MTLVPSSEFLTSHVAILRASYLRWTGQSLIDPAINDEQAVACLDAVPFGVVSHGVEADPVFNYANRSALALFEMTWDEFTATPSRLSAEPMEREARSRLLERVTRDGYINDYSGVRTAASGRRFMIRNATVWNLIDTAGRPCGQAAMIPEWEEYA